MEIIGDICKDIFLGLIDSIRIDLFLSHIYKSNKCNNILKKIFKYNVLFHILPGIIIELINFLFQVSFHTLLYYINYLINFMSMFMHMIIYLEIFGTFNKFSLIPKSKLSNPITDSITITIIMTIYQLAVYLMTKIINFIFGNQNLYFISLIINFVILTIYHTIYSHNNLWQVLNLNLIQRINIHETRWAYFLGYGSIITVMYNYTYNPYILAIYNVYITNLLFIPLLKKINFQNNNISYPKLNLSIFSYIISWIFSIIRQLLKLIK
jgi:hypothetical protein